MLHLSEGRADDAWQDLLTCHRLGRHVGNGATLIEALVGIAIDNLASQADLVFVDNAKLSSKEILNCLRDLGKLRPLPLMAEKIDLGERFLFLDSIRIVDRDGIDALSNSNGLGPPENPDSNGEQLLKSIDWDLALRNGNRWYDRIVQALRSADRDQREKRIREIEGDLKALKAALMDSANLAKLVRTAEEPDKALGKAMGDILIGLMVPAFGRIQHAADRSEQTHRNLALAFALAAYQRDHRQYPKNLEAVAPMYLAKIPNDLFTGKALIYRPSANGYLLYSVGVNRQDDGGRSSDDAPHCDDLPVRMPLPKMRRD